MDLNENTVSTASTTRESRPRRREGPGSRVSSSRSSEASFDMNEPPPTPKPVKSEKNDTPGSSHSCKIEGQVKKQKVSPQGRRPLRRQVPKTPSPTGSSERTSSPVRRKVRKVPESQELDRPPPTPSVPRTVSPLPSTSKLKAEPKTPRPEERSPPSNALVAYSASEAAQRRAEASVARPSASASVSFH